jgi:hypothetical protein
MTYFLITGWISKIISEKARDDKIENRARFADLFAIHKEELMYCVID